jgi:hypothetical protein
MSHQWVDNLSAMLQNQDEPQAKVRLAVAILELLMNYLFRNSSA